MLHGGCLCRSVRYEVDGDLGIASHCHCSMCRKAHGAAFGTYAGTDAAGFRIVSGVEDMARYVSSPGIARTFCRRCGSTLLYLTEERPDRVSIALGTLDDDPLVRPQVHIFVESKAHWFEITDGLPQHVGYG